MSEQPKFDQRYRCYAQKMDIEMFCDARSRGQARFRYWKAAREAGYKLDFTDIKVRLAYVAEEAMNAMICREKAAIRDKRGL